MLRTRNILVRIRQYHWLTDPDPASRWQQKIFFFPQFFFAYFFIKVHLPHVSKIKSVKEKSSNSKKSRFFLRFLLDDGRIPIRTNNDGSGSGRPKNIWILWIRNTGSSPGTYTAALYIFSTFVQLEYSFWKQKSVLEVAILFFIFWNYIIDQRKKDGLAVNYTAWEKKNFNWRNYLGAFSAPQLDIDVSNRCFCIPWD
jgi:hypothetical protein